MRKVIMINRVSIDGYYASNDEATQGMNWFVHDPLVDAAVHRPVKSDTLVLGHATFRLFESAWVPFLSDPDAPPPMKAVAQELTQMRKLVFTKGRPHSDWKNTEFVRDDPVSAVSALRNGAGSDLLILGSGSIVRQLAAARLIDEYQFIVSPVVSGSGKALFSSLEQQDLTLVSTEAFASGNVVLHYRVSPLPTK